MAKKKQPAPVEPEPLPVPRLDQVNARARRLVGLLVMLMEVERDLRELLAAQQGAGEEPNVDIQEVIQPNALEAVYEVRALLLREMADGVEWDTPLKYVKDWLQEHGYTTNIERVTAALVDEHQEQPAEGEAEAGG